MSSRKLTDLSQELQPLAVAFLDACYTEGIDILIYCTYRSNAEQAELYARGRTSGGSIVTNARAGESRHNDTLNGLPAANAFDCVPLLRGKCVWDAHDPLWRKVGALGESVGLEWAGRWSGKLRETAHFQLRGK